MVIVPVRILNLVAATMVLQTLKAKTFLVAKIFRKKELVIN